MGGEGSKKTSFISKLVGDDVVVRQPLESGTAFLHLNSDNRSILSTGKEEVSVYSFVYKHPRRVYLLHMPEFDETNPEDVDPLKDVAYFLSKTYNMGFTLSGVIYLCGLTDVENTGSAWHSMNMLKRLCGERKDICKHVLFAIDVKMEEGKQEAFLERKFWSGEMYQSRVCRYDDT